MTRGRPVKCNVGILAVRMRSNCFETQCQKDCWFIALPALPSTTQHLRCYTRPAAKLAITCGAEASKPTTSSIPGSAGSAMEKPFEAMPTTMSFAS